MLYRNKVYKVSILRYSLTILGLVFASSLIVFSLYYNDYLYSTLEDSIYLDYDEYHVYYDENRFSDINRNFFLALKEEFGDVEPYIEERMNVVISDESYLTYVYGVDSLSSVEKLYFDQEFHEIITYKNNEIIQENCVFLSTNILDFYPDISVVSIENNSFCVSGFFEIEAGSSDIFVLIENNDYIEYIDAERYIELDGNFKILYDRYLVTSDESEESIRTFISNLFYDPTPSGEYIESFTELLEVKVSDEFPFTIIISFVFVVIVVFSMLNIFNTISFNILERKRANTILLSLGLRPKVLKNLIIIEFVVLGFIGSIISLIIGTIVFYVFTLYYGNTVPILLSLTEYLLILFSLPAVMGVYTYIFLKFIDNNNLVLNTME